MVTVNQSNRLDVAMFFRGRHTGYYSIEKVFETVRAALPPHIEAHMVAAPVHAQGFWRRVYCLLYAATNRAAVNHITGDISFVAAALPGDRTIVTLHDFDHLYRLSGLRAALFRMVYFTIPFRRCRYITTISAQVARELAELFPWAARKTVVIPDCLPADFTYTPRDFHAERPVVLQIGAKPNKNLESLIQALEGLPCELHIVGTISGAHRDLLARCGVPYRNSVDIAEPELRRAYVDADIVSFVSSYEGFGLPILEGNAVGRPVVTSNIPPMSDVAGQAACLVDPNSIESIRAGITRLIGDPDYRAYLVARGLENVRRYSAAEVASRFAALYEVAAAQDVDLEQTTRPAPVECLTARKVL